MSVLQGALLWLRWVGEAVVSVGVLQGTLLLLRWVGEAVVFI